MCLRASLRRAARTRRPYRRLCVGVADSSTAEGQHETFVFLGNLGVGISAERLAAGDFDGYDEVFLLLDDTDDYQGDVETRPAAHCLTISFRGTHGQAAPHYEQLLGYMRKHNLAPAGPSREIALIDGIISDNPATYVT